jgi:uncharacterized protein YdeI (YjbR/CyaY-like superfamily)
MPSKDPRIDAYISRAQPFAQPILKRLRKLVHHACPGVEETIKWGMPAFEYKGPYFGMAAFKRHCVAGFWKSKLLRDPKNFLGERKSQGGEAMGNLGCLRTLEDLPPDKALIDFLKQAKKLNDDGVKLPRSAAAKKKVVIPKELAAALKKNAKARAMFDNLPPSHKREYAEWIAEAKTAPTRERRLQTALQWMADGKSRNWKYERKR